MKATRRLFVGLLLTAVLVSMTCITAFAKNYENKSFYNFTLETDERYLKPQSKEDDSPCYLRITAATTGRVTYISANGCATGELMVFRDNKTLDGYGQIQQHVVVSSYQDYRIRSRIYESGYRFASLGFSCSADFGNEVSGVWSPDSLGTYPFAYSS
jgi:hypothetical protein